MTPPGAAMATILIVDDTPTNLAVLSNHLNSHGFLVAIAQDGLEALERARYARPDLILMDVMMPGMNGIDACRELKKDALTKDIPVIFMTALADSADKVAGFSVGGVDYITKPFLVEEVVARVHTHLALQSMQRQLAVRNLELQQERDSLERRVETRTAELAQANAALRHENLERARMQSELREQERRSRRLFEANIIGIFYWHLDGQITDANDAFLELTGYSPDDLAANALQWDKLTPQEHRAADERAIEELRARGSCEPYEKEFVGKDGNRVPVLLGAAFFAHSPDTGVAFVLDLSKRKKAEERISFMAHHDALTHLPNRVLLQDRIRQAIAHARRSGRRVAVLFLDLDYFKRINDSLGHEIGDKLLQMTADRLRHSMREVDNIGRLGGDEFVLSLPAIGDSGDAAMVARKTLDALDMPFEIDGHQLHITGSIGISLYPDDGEDVETLMRAADTAMYHAKESGRGNFQFFTPALNQAVHRRLALENRLRQALGAGRFTLNYQPQIDMRSGRMFSSEALLRLRDAIGESQVACGDFIDVAEETGLIMPLGEWALATACRQLKIWQESGYPDLHVAVNLSPRQFFQPDLPDMISRIVDETGISAASLDLEITESVLLERNNNNLAILQRLHRLGIHLSIDDFGTGYSSLAYLQRYPIHTIKIDRSFIGGIGRSANDSALVAAIIAMAHSMDIGILAEGVETASQAEFLIEHGCPHAQGFFYSDAMPADALGELLANANGANNPDSAGKPAHGRRPD